MWMKDEEIARSYRESTKRKAQIGVLADLNLCSKKEIEEILIKMGEIKPPKEKKPQEAPKEEVKEITGGSEMKTIPECIAQYAFDKLDQLEKEIEIHQKQIKSLEKEYKEIAEFLDGRERAKMPV